MIKISCWLMAILLLGPSLADAQYDIRISHAPPPSCSNTMRVEILPKANMANAVCRPKVYKSKNRRVKYALQRIARWRDYAQAKWDEEHQDVFQTPNGKIEPPLYPTYTYDRAVVYMYEQWAEECDRFNGKLADALIALHHLNRNCQDTLGYESLRRMWRDNLQVRDIYKSYSESQSPTRGVASERPSVYHNR
ncbi:MAG: hypothetical protein HRT44_12020 [Bdellovibrionales bacterium]|nr:hypothetical protein [Bdellovibrionales bacterium]NQZ19965.1 hypothetical protein [Bdellovibrionales bacterium]